MGDGDTGPPSDGPAGDVWLNCSVLGAGPTSALGNLYHEIRTELLPGLLAILGILAGHAWMVRWNTFR